MAGEWKSDRVSPRMESEVCAQEDLRAVCRCGIRGFARSISGFFEIFKRRPVFPIDIRYDSEQAHMRHPIGGTDGLETDKPFAGNA